MAESTLSLAYVDLTAAIGRFLGHGDPSGYGDPATYGTKAYIVERYILAGVRKFIFPPPIEPGKPPHSWSFLKPTTTLTTQGPYSAGTVHVINGSTTVVLSGGTLPTWVASGVLVVLGLSYGIATRTDSTHFELDAPFPGTTNTAASYAIDQRDYDLPDEFGYIEGDITYEPNISMFRAIQVVGEGKIRERRQHQSAYSARPLLAAIRPKHLVASTSAGQRWEIMFWPTPDSSYLLSYKFAVLPDKLSATSIYTYGGMAHAETLKEACLAAAEEGENDTMGLHGQAFQRQLAASIGVDMRSRPQLVGYNADRSDSIHGRRFDRFNGVVTYTDRNGTVYP